MTSFSNIFGYQDRGLKELIESQASTTSKIEQKNTHNVKKMVKTTNMRANNTRRVNTRKK